MVVNSSAKEARKSKDTWAEYMRQYRKARPEIIHNSDLRKKYGIGRKEYLELLEKQGEVCAICKQPETTKDHRGKERNFAVDHDHQTGRIRGLLCTPCNRALGMFKDDPELVSNALKYLAGA